MVHHQEAARSIYEFVVETYHSEPVFAEPGDSGSLVFAVVNDQTYLAGILSQKYDNPTGLDASASYRVHAVFSWLDYTEQLVKERIESDG